MTKSWKSCFMFASFHSLTTQWGTCLHLHIRAITQLISGVAAQCITSLIYRSGALFNLHIKHVISLTLTVAWLLLMDWFLKLLISWDLHTEKPIDLWTMVQKKKNRNAFGWERWRQEWTDWFELTGLSWQYVCGNLNNYSLQSGLNGGHKGNKIQTVEPLPSKAKL